MSNYNDHDLISFSDEEEMDVRESGELGDEGNLGQGIVGEREDPKNTGKIEMEGVAGNGKVVPLVTATALLKARQMYTHSSKERRVIKPLRHS